VNSDAWPYVVEPMRLEDIPTVSVIERLVYSRPWPVEAYRYELLENTRSHYYVAKLRQGEEQRPAHGLKAALRRALSGPELDESLLGYAGLWLMVDEAHVSTLAVHTRWQGKGLGELLLATLVVKAIELEAQFITLEVRVSNHRAQNLYRKYGFRQTGMRYRYYSDNNEDALIMTTAAPGSDSYQARFLGLLDALDARLRGAAPRPTEALATEDTG
jgi:[ribosomal protein S18]-alanine N-acetyltransferase